FPNINFGFSIILIPLLVSYPPRALEPVYGNILPYHHYTTAIIVLYIFGLILGMKVTGPLCRPSFYDPHPPIASVKMVGRLWATMAVILSMAQSLLPYLFSWCMYFGPMYGPHVTQLVYGYPVALLLGMAVATVAYTMAAKKDWT